MDAEGTASAGPRTTPLDVGNDGRLAPPPFIPQTVVYEASNTLTSPTFASAGTIPSMMVSGWRNMGAVMVTLPFSTASTNYLNVVTDTSSWSIQAPPEGTLVYTQSTAEDRAWQTQMEYDAQRAEQYRIYEAQREERRRAEQEANARARALFLSLLTPEQQATFTDARKGYVEVTGSEGRRYRLYSCRTFNIMQMGARGRIRARLCVTLRGADTPMADVLAAQLLMLRSNEKQLRDIANIKQEYAD